MGCKKLYVELISHSMAPEAVVATGARLCYSESDIKELSQRSSTEDQSAFLKKLVDMGHLSPIEHASFTFGVQGVSRALLAQITRHRIASFSVQSQRYVDQTGLDGFSYVIPPSIAALGADAIERYDKQMKQMAAWYDEWCDQVGASRKEDARFVLPNACETRIIMTMNARELMHMLEVRCCERAQWEIRAMAWAMLGHLLKAAPELFKNSGPRCISSACTEGKMSCGNKKDVSKRYDELKRTVDEMQSSENFSERISEWASDHIV